MKVMAQIADREGKSVEVVTVAAGADGKPLVSIEHYGHALVVAADAMVAAIKRARISEGYGDDLPF